MNRAVVFLAFAIATSASMSSWAQQGLPSGAELMVGFYGRPGSTALGVLGEHAPDELAPLVRAKADEYARVAGKQSVMPAFHLIYGLASSEPGRHKEYILPLSEKKVMEYVESGKRNGFAVILDLQLGALTPAEEVKSVLAFLKHDNVHLAIDPEFEVNGLDVRPGKVIGHISGEDVNEVQSMMSEYLKENGIKGTKMLIVHMFTQHMVSEKGKIKKYEGIDLVFNLDGHGSAQLKVDVYNNLYSGDLTTKGVGGFKLFFKEDKPSLMTPRQVLGLDSVGGTGVKRPPRYINYQ